MKQYESGQIRNVALVGHSSCGKTLLAESMLFTAGVTTRMGKIEDGNTVSDYDKEEINRKMSIGTSLIPIEWKNNKFNILDAPGYFDFVGETNAALAVSEGAIIVLDASSGIEVGTEKVWKYTSDHKIARFIFLNKMDKENIKYDKLFDELRESLGKSVVPIAIPIGSDNNFKGYVDVVEMVGKECDGKSCKDIAVPDELADQAESLREILTEAVAESDEELLEKFFEGEPFTNEELRRGLRKGIVAGDIIPVLVGSAIKNIGAQMLLDMIGLYMPTPEEKETYKGTNPKDQKPAERKISASEPFAAYVFKTTVDPYVGKISLMKVISGKLSGEMEVYNPNKDKSEKIGSPFLLRGKNQIEIDKIVAGDIVAVSKLQYASTGDTLCDKGNPIVFPAVEFPEPTLFMAVVPKAKGDEDKIGIGLQKLLEEDPTFSVERNVETGQTLISGQGDIHLGVIKSKLKNKFGVDVDLADPIVAYRETIKGKSDVQGKHKKQSGGHGQYGDVKIRFEPAQEEFVFTEEIFGGAVPKNYIPAVEKGLREAMASGVLAGYPVVNIKATLYDGS
ncbi:MAG TPA: elongation factor G, partial [Clostridiales bacterium]|nr:elongation factor G [Clostridiales bacterium]